MAKKFKLQSVLNYRQTLEDQARQRLAETQQQQSEVERRLAVEQQALQQLAQELKSRQQQGVSIAELQLYEDQIGHRRQRLENLCRQLQQLGERMQQQREELLLASREKKVMEKLKEKQAVAYRQELARQERNLLDEISTRLKGDSE